MSYWNSTMGTVSIPKKRSQLLKTKTKDEGYIWWSTMIYILNYLWTINFLFIKQYQIDPETDDLTYPFAIVKFHSLKNLQNTLISLPRNSVKFKLGVTLKPWTNPRNLRSVGEQWIDLTNESLMPLRIGLVASLSPL